MSRTAILSDIHANYHALCAVVEDLSAEQCTDIVCLGDVVGYNAYPRECLDYIRSLSCPVVKGNHDEEVSTPSMVSARMNPAARMAMEWTRTQLDQEQLLWLARLQYQRIVRPSHGSSFTIVHSTLDQPKAWNYIFNANDAASNFRRQFSEVCFHGHTHVPKFFYWDGAHAREDYSALHPMYVEHSFYVECPLQAGMKYFVNVGSVGQPRDHDPRACYAIYDNDRNVVIFKRVEYDLRAAQEAIRSVGLPEYLAERLENGS